MLKDIMVGVDPDKRDRVINAAIEEFATYPYEKASTNNIVKKAGISKGLLFHYFKNKQALFEQLTGFVIHTLYNAIISRINWEETDLFERIKQIAIVKLEVSQTYPHMFDFLFKLLAYKKTSDIEAVLQLYRDYGLDFTQLNQDIYTRNVDYTRFRDLSAISETINIVRWALEKYGEEQLQQISLTSSTADFTDMAVGLDHYMMILKDAFYTS